MTVTALSEVKLTGCLCVFNPAVKVHVNMDRFTMMSVMPTQ